MPSVDTIGAPSGVRGVHGVPYAAQSVRQRSPRQDLHRRCSAGCSSRVRPSTSKRRLGVVVRRYSSASFRPLPGIAPMPRQARSPTLEHAPDRAPAPRVLPARRTARAYWFSTSARPCLELRGPPSGCPRAGRAARSRSPRSARGSASAIGSYSRPAHDRADVPGGEERLHLVVRRRRGSRSSPAAPARATTSMLKFGSPSAAAAQHRHGVGRRGGLEADGEEHHLAVGVGRAAMRDRVERRVDDADVARPRALAARAGRRRSPGTRSMSPNEREDRRSGRAAIASAWSMSSSGVTQTGQPGPWIIRDPGRARARRCPAARWCGSARRRPPSASTAVSTAARDLGEQVPRERRVAVFVEVLHDVVPRRAPGRAPLGASSAPSVAHRPQNLQGSLRLGLVHEVMANPTWTMT